MKKYVYCICIIAIFIFFINAIIEHYYTIEYVDGAWCNVWYNENDLYCETPWAGYVYCHYHNSENFECYPPISK